MGVERGLAFAATQAVSAERSAWYAILIDLFDRDDALALPSAQLWPFPREWALTARLPAERWTPTAAWMETVVPVSLAGVSALGMPADFGSGGLPMGFQLFGPRGAKRRVLELGHA